MFDFNKYIKEKYTHEFYTDSVEEYERFRVHSDGDYPKKLIEGRRPGESKEIHKYRKEIYKCVTKTAFSKVQNTISKIRKSSDWTIKYDLKQIPKSVIEKETLNNYMEVDFPRYGSFTNWMFSVCLKQYLIDANAVSLVMPKNTNVKGNEYLKPYPVIYNSPQILDYTGEYYFLLSKEKSSFVVSNRKVEGSIYYYVDSEKITKYTQTAQDAFTQEDYTHGLGRMPVVRLNGVLKEDTITGQLFESRISSILERFDEAVREYSDMQAEIVQHNHSTMWALQQQVCMTCKGAGEVAKKNAAPVKCPDCKGKGHSAFNPYEYLEIKPGQLGQPQISPPFAGYITKPIDIAKLQDVRINDHIYYGLSGLNMEFLTAVPLTQSGTAKNVDRAELNNFVFTCGEDIIRIMDEHYSISNDYRNSAIVPDKEKRDLMLPEIPVPEKYDLVGEEVLTSEIQKLKTAKVSPAIISEAEIEYASKKFNTNPKVRDSLMMMFKLDPLASKSEEDILTESSQGWVSKEAGVIHANIKDFIEQATSEDEDFASKDLKEQKEVIKKLAQKFIADNSAKVRTLNVAAGDNQQAA